MYLLIDSFTGAKNALLMPPCLPLINPYDILQKCTSERIGHENEKVFKRTVSLEVKFESNINEIIEEISVCGNADSATIRETLGRQLLLLQLSHFSRVRLCVTP